MKRSPNTRVSSPTILKLKARTYHSAVFRGSGAFRWMWLIRNAMIVVLRRELDACQDLLYIHPIGRCDDGPPGRTVLFTGTARDIGAGRQRRRVSGRPRLRRLSA